MIKTPAMANLWSNRTEYIISALLLGIIFLMILPVPPVLIDIVLTLSIGFSLCIFLAAIYVESPMELSVFPTLLLVATLSRLSINIATTRLILLKGNEGVDAAGKVISTFGEFVVGGNYVVGIIVFLILVIINFVVITKGAGRVSEVGARFILDAMPGKQMAIDADLSAGLIGDQEAKVRRKQVEAQADFYGSMDGASKFVRGDAIAGLLITGINIVAGFAIGVTQGDMSASEAAQTYTILTVGDGMVSQIPALLISTAAGIIATRSTTSTSLGPVIANQLLKRRKPLGIAGAMLGIMAFIPGMPAIPFLIIGGSLIAVSRKKQQEQTESSEQIEREPQLTEKERLEALLPIDLLGLEVGYELVPMVDSSQGGELIGRISVLRRNLVAELGIIMPPIHVRDNLQLGPREYRFLLYGNEIGKGIVWPKRLLAIDPGGNALPIRGEKTNEPTFGLPAVWIVSEDRADADLKGYTIVDPSTVIITHITEMIRNHAGELLGRNEAQELFDVLARSHPRLVEELIPALLSPTEIISVLRDLLREGISIRNMRKIFETLLEYAPRTKDTELLVEYVRRRLSRDITNKFRGEDNRVYGLVLDSGFENEVRQSVPSQSSKILGIEPRLGKKLLSSVESLATEFGRTTAPPLIITSPDLRRAITDFLKPRIPGLSVVSYSEIAQGTEIIPLGMAGLPGKSE